MRGIQPEVIELYKNKEFVSHSISSTCFSSVKFSVDGQKTTQCLGQIGDRHLKADPKLPKLQERCASASNKHLYTLSQQLAENDALDTETEIDQPKRSVDQPTEQPRMHRRMPKMPWRRNDLNENFDSDYQLVKKSKKSKERSVRKVLEKAVTDKEVSASEPQIAKRKMRKLKSKSERKKSPIASSDESCYKTARAETSAKPSQTKVQECQTAKSTAKLMPFLEADQKLLELEQQRTMPPLQIDPKITNLLDGNVHRALQITKQTVKMIDDWHIFSLLLFAGTFGYLIYILYYDINEYINEERRYLEKMRKAGIVLKCFYYVMRLLKVPIF
ncbi:hypothetical protein KR222_011557 [Zaprionus bogoriensis]|nr:hypothetical protein KR222_011557 [Zaprionus bogoriensis]